MKTQILLSIIMVLLLSIGLYIVSKYIDIYYLKPIIIDSNSVFNNIKLIVIPVLVYIVLDLIIYKKNRKHVFESYISGILIAIIFYICSYYTYRGITGSFNIYIDYVLYFISVLIIFIFRYKKTTLLDSVSSVVFLIILILILVVFSFYPSNISIFN